MKNKNKVSVAYLTKEGFRSVWTNRMMSTASVAVLMSCLVIVGCAVMLFLNISAVLDRVGDQNVVMVYVNENLEQGLTDKVGEDIKNISNIDSVTFVPREQAWQEQINAISDDNAQLFEGLENPLPNAYKVTVSDLEGFEASVAEIKKIENIESVLENSQIAGQLIKISNAVTAVSIVIIVLLLLVSLFIISNTVRITMFSRSLEISIMKSVGATNSFIRWPFVIEGMVLGTVSALVSLGLVAAIYAACVRSFSGVIAILGGSMLPFSDYWFVMLLAFLFVGVFTGVFGSSISMRRYLKEQRSESNEI